MHPVQQVQYLVPVSSGGTVLRPGMLVRGRVVPSAGGMVFEHSGGKMPLAGDGARETGWKLWRVEARNDGLVVRELPARVQPAGFSPAAGLTRLVTALFADKAVRRQVLAAMQGQASTGEAVLSGLHPQAAARVRQLFERVRASDKGEPVGKVLASLAREWADDFTVSDEARTEGEGVQPAALLVCNGLFPDTDEVPLLVVQQDTVAGPVTWLFAGFELGATGPLSVGIRLQAGRVSADIWCPRHAIEVVRDEVQARCPWPVRVHQSRCARDILEWPFDWMAGTGGVDARA